MILVCNPYPYYGQANSTLMDLGGLGQRNSFPDWANSLLNYSTSRDCYPTVVFACNAICIAFNKGNTLAPMAKTEKHPVAPKQGGPTEVTQTGALHCSMRRPRLQSTLMSVKLSTA